MFLEFTLNNPISLWQEDFNLIVLDQYHSRLPEYQNIKNKKLYETQLGNSLFHP